MMTVKSQGVIQSDEGRLQDMSLAMNDDLPFFGGLGGEVHPTQDESVDQRRGLCKSIRAFMESQNVQSERDIGACLVCCSLKRRGNQDPHRTDWLYHKLCLKSEVEALIQSRG